jgi:multicomponent Na+:H+ antiporter subunit D
MSILIPIVLPLFAMVLLIISRRWLMAQYVISMAAMTALVVNAVLMLASLNSTGYLVYQASGWPAPFGITLIADYFSVIILLAVATVGWLVMVYAIGFMDTERKKAGFFILVQGLFAGVNGALVTGDLFNLYVWFEVMIMASFVLITHGAEKQQLRGAVKYVVLNLVGSVFLVSTVGLVYAKTGTLNMAQLASMIQLEGSAGLMNSHLMLFFIAFGIKAAVFPFFFWLPASYPTPPIAITAFFSATLTKVGVYTIIRFYSLFVVQDDFAWKEIILWVSAATMVFGVLMAASSFDFRKILSFHIISQIGYMIMGLGIFTVTGLAGAVFFIVHNMFSKTAAFMAGGLVYKLKGTYNLKMSGWIYKEKPLFALLFFLPALSLAGLPPTPGFFGKLFLIMAGFGNGDWAITITALAVSIFTLFSMVKIWNEVYWKKPVVEGVEVSTGEGAHNLSVAATLVIVVLMLLMGLFAGGLFGYFSSAAEQLLDVQAYIDAVFN